MLTIEVQKRLTEFLGDRLPVQRWKVIHSKFHNQVAKSGFVTREAASEYAEKSAKRYPHLGAVVEEYRHGKNLDFTDGRVIMRLIDKAKVEMSLEYTQDLAVWQTEIFFAWEPSVYSKGSTPQEAICLAIYAYLTKEDGR